MKIKKSYEIISIGAYLLLVIVLLGSIHYLIGMRWIASDMFAINTNGGGNLTGLGIIIGLELVTVGIGFLIVGLVLTYKIITLNEMGRWLAIFFLGYFSLLLLINPEIIKMPLSLFEIDFTLCSFALLLLNIASLLYLLSPKVIECFAEERIKESRCDDEKN